MIATNHKVYKDSQCWYSVLSNDLSMWHNHNIHIIYVYHTTNFILILPYVTVVIPKYYTKTTHIKKIPRSDAIILYYYNLDKGVS